MVSRENRVQLVAMALALVVLAGFALVLPDDPGVEWLVVFGVVFYAIVFGGAHFYLYLRGAGGSVPRSARGRFLVTLGIVIPLWAGGLLLQESTIFSVSGGVLLGGSSVLVFVVYFLNEVRLGYEGVESASESG